MVNAIVPVLILIAILAVPVNITARLLKANLTGFGWAFLASLLAFALFWAVAVFIPTPFIALPVIVAGSIAIFSVALGVSLPKASLLFLVAVLSLGVLGLVVLMVGPPGTKVGIDLFGHHYSYSR